MELEFKARQTSKQTNIHTNKHRTLKLRCLQPPVKMERRVEWSNIICHEQTSNIFCNHFRVSATDIIQQVSSVTLNVSTRVTLQNNTLQSIKPFTILTMARSSHSLEWIQMSVIHCNIGSVNPQFHLFRRFRGSSVFMYYVCLHVCWTLVCLLN